MIMLFWCMGAVAFLLIPRPSILQNTEAAQQLPERNAERVICHEVTLMVGFVLE